MFYEITFETGRSSVAYYEDEEEAKRAIGEQHRRAVEGESGGPQGANWVAERVVKVRMYDKHPNEFNPDQTMSADVMKKELGALVDALADDNGVVAVDQLAVQARALSHPMVTSKEHAFDSNFLMKEKKELALSFLEGGK